MIRIDPNVTEMPEPIPWVSVVTISAAVGMARLLEFSPIIKKKGIRNEMARLIALSDRVRNADSLG